MGQREPGVGSLRRGSGETVDAVASKATECELMWVRFPPSPELASADMNCIGCGADVADESGPVHRYLAAAPGCWRIYGEVLAREYGDPAYARAHRLGVDAYAVQHPGTESPQTTGSAGVHLARLCLILERELPLADADAAMAHFAANSKGALHWLDPPQHQGPVTVVDVWRATNPHMHHDAVLKWAASAWAAWAAHHEQIRSWVDRFGRRDGYQ